MRSDEKFDILVVPIGSIFDPTGELPFQVSFVGLAHAPGDPFGRGHGDHRFFVGLASFYAQAGERMGVGGIDCAGDKPFGRPVFEKV